MAKNMKTWKCKNGHVMGVVRWEGHDINRLVLFREALAEGEDGDVMAVVEGYVADVRCSTCGDLRTWVPGEAALRRLLKNFEGGRHVETKPV
jgi:hypothetical protein